ncbi:hypothetical protein ACTXMH_00600 [Psychrobacter celer]|uniref:hypothetical protein n=1 Tax=Psychrobacter TaxID=497 RepID=UPI0009472CC2|nr:hypothetical protein [Psychrobacter sp. Rd 27.2]OLF41512.1 hypothetical protein BTV99_03100 [Psychrobacter sp. Rd 27.2]
MSRFGALKVLTDTPNHHMVVIAQEDIFIMYWQKHAKYLYLFTIWLMMDLLHYHAPRSLARQLHHYRQRTI